MEALIFDFDGLIVDTELPAFNAWQEIYRQHGQELPLEIWSKVIGTDEESSFDPHKYLEELTGRTLDREAIWSEHSKSYSENIESQPVLPGVREYLQDAKDMRLKLAVASSGKRSWVAGNLTRFGLLDYFQVICTSEDVEKVKPDPALFLLAAEKLGVRPQEAIVFEDSYNGLVAAKKAGTFVVIVPNPLTKHMDFSQADIKLKSLADLPLKDLLARAAHAEEPSAAD